MPNKSTEPEVVYHYTSMETMLKIVDSRSIWASSMDYLNDTSEGKHFVRQVSTRLPGFVEQHGYGSEFIPEMRNEIQREVPFQIRPYVASFSAENDSLPQWRAYCSAGNGVAIGFSVDCLKRAFFAGSAEGKRKTVALTFTPVTYTEVTLPDKVIDKEIKDSIKATDVLVEYAKATNRDIRRETAFRVLIEAQASSRKHSSFSHEREYRITVHPNLVPEFSLDFRPAGTTLVPFVKLGIPEKRSGYENANYERPSAASILGGRGRFQFIDRVVIGPTPNAYLSMRAVREYFNHMRLDVEVVRSDIPFRDW